MPFSKLRKNIFIQREPRKYNEIQVTESGRTTNSALISIILDGQNLTFMLFFSDDDKIQSIGFFSDDDKIQSIVKYQMEYVVTNLQKWGSLTEIKVP